jgi:hypothetical protein
MLLLVQGCFASEENTSNRLSSSIKHKTPTGRYYCLRRSDNYFINYSFLSAASMAPLRK